MPETLPAEYGAALAQTAARRGPVGRQLYYFSEIGSTNDEAAALAERGAAHGVTVVASAQTAGRGRFGRSWFSPPGAGLYVSVVCRSTRAMPFLTLAAGVAAAEAITAATGLPVEIKWPNDIVMTGAAARRRKLAGVLAEGCAGADGLQYVVLGFGINLRPAAYPREIADRATSLEAELGRPPDAPLLLAELLAALSRWIQTLEADGPGVLLGRWRALAPSAQGQTVEWEGSGGLEQGRTAGLGDDGALLVQTAGRVERIISGTLRWL
jgi:BirA family transcriptional regulator, biotin operon repressor / biotin---[acetyl-CoA-carboxylase] ligase